MTSEEILMSIVTSIIVMCAAIVLFLIIDIEFIRTYIGLITMYLIGKLEIYILSKKEEKKKQ